LSQPRIDAQGKPIRAPTGAVPPRSANAAPVQVQSLTDAMPSSAPPTAETPEIDPKRQVRTVGPTYLPGR
jgi:hypothetical protein